MAGKEIFSREKNILESKDLKKILCYIEGHSFGMKTQCWLLDQKKLANVLIFYISVRKLCQKAIKKLISIRGVYDKSIIMVSVIGNNLDKENEKLLVGNYPELLEEYLEANPERNYLGTSEVENFAEECGLGWMLDRFHRPN